MPFFATHGLSRVPFEDDERRTPRGAGPVSQSVPPGGLFAFDEEAPGQQEARTCAQPLGLPAPVLSRPVAVPGMGMVATPPAISFLEQLADAADNRPFSPMQQQGARGVPQRPGSVDWTLRLFALGDFALGRTVGTGTFGRVRLARLRNHDKFFAMKIMRKQDIVRLHQIDHIFSEKQLLSRLACPFVIRLYGTFKDRDHLYMLLEYAVGGELFTHMRRALRLPAPATRFYAAEIVLALEYLHGLGIVYRDLKPENLLLDARGHVKIADFGFAKVVPENVTWTLCGTPEYLAPEIILGRGHGRPVDWWALGILIYEMLAGFPPYYHDTPFLIYEKILAGGLVFPEHFDPLVCDLLRGLLDPDPQRRLGGGVLDARAVMAHPWFAPVDWDATARRLVPPPFAPPAAHPGDTCNFEEYPEDDPPLVPLLLDAQPPPDLNAIFADF